MGYPENTAPDYRPRMTAFEPLLSVDQTATLLGVTRRQVYNLLRKKGLPATRVGTRIRIRPEELRAWLEESRL
jgi:excisionase family DNA binding protein